MNDAAIEFPTHAWAGDELGRNCAECQPETVWRHDHVAHKLGESERALRLLRAIDREGKRNPATEAAARAMWEGVNPGHKWDETFDDDYGKEGFLDDAALAYDAMAPLIRAECLREAAKDAEYELDIVGEPKETAPSSWLRARAEAEGDGRGL